MARNLQLSYSEVSYSEVMVKRWQAIFAVAVLLPGVFAQQTHQGVVGTCSSSATIMIDDAEMSPTAAASWPVVAGDEIAATSAPALLTTVDHNLVTFERESKVRIGSVENGQTYLYVRQGGLLFDTTTRHLFICIGNRLFVPDAGSQAVLRIEKSGAVSRTLRGGRLLEQGERACGEQPPANLVAGLPVIPSGTGGVGAGGIVSGAGGAAGGTATAAGAGAGAAGGVAGVAAGAVGAGSAAAAGAAGTFANSCTTPGGCNHNPLSISPSTP
jgi:hypothetical protein